MAFLAGAIVGDLVINTSKFTGPLNVAVGFAVQAASTISSTLGGALKDSVFRGIELAAAFEQSEVAFETMLGSAERAKQLLGQLDDFSIKTPFELPEIEGAARKLVAFGLPAEGVIGTLTSLGNVASGTGQRVGELATVYGQVLAKGKLQGDELLQFAERGVPLGMALAKSFGVAQGEIADMIRKGEVDFATFARVFREMEQSRFGGLMEKQAKTAAGAWANMQDAMTRALRKGGQRFLEAANPGDLMGKMTDAMGKAQPLIESFFGGLGEAAAFALPPLIDLGVALSDGVAGSLEAIKPLAETLKPILKDLADEITGNLTPAFQSMGDVLKPIAENLKEIIEAADKLLGPLGGLKAVGAGVFRKAVPGVDASRVWGQVPEGGRQIIVNTVFDPRESAGQFTNRVVPKVAALYQRQRREVDGMLRAFNIARRSGGTVGLPGMSYGGRRLTGE